MVSQDRVARLEEVQSAIREKLEEHGGSMNLSEIFDELADGYEPDEIRYCVTNLQQEGRICFTLGDQFGLPD